MHRLLEELYTSAVVAAMPGHALTLRLERTGLPVGHAPWIIALGKAAIPMAAAAVQELGRRRLEPMGGLIVSPREAPAPHPTIDIVTGDHPEPAARSLAASDALHRFARRIGPHDQVWLLLSGGTSSLIAAPIHGVSMADLTAIYRLVLRSGLDIGAMNTVRKRFARWSAGRLAEALAPARVRGFVISDVIGDDLATIGSGPCTPDLATAGDVRRLLEEAELWNQMPESARNLIAAVERREIPETPKPGDRAFANVAVEVIVSNRLAVEAAAAHAQRLGLTTVTVPAPLDGEAAAAGTHVATTLLQYCAAASSLDTPAGRPTHCIVWGGETTVDLRGAEPGVGGRCQELALAAARHLTGAPAPVAILAAGTDGRDGPTDAAGAIVDGTTWDAIVTAGRDPAQDLAAHNAYHALDAAGALLRPGHSGTNVMDVVIGIG